MAAALDLRALAAESGGASPSEALAVKPLHLVVLAIVLAGIVLALARDDVLDFLVEGDEDPWYVEAGRYEGAWKFEGYPNELEVFAPGLLRIEFRTEDPPPGFWKGHEPPQGGDGSLTQGLGTCRVDGREYRFRIRREDPRPPMLMDPWLQFEERLPFLTERAYGEGFGVSLEAKRDPSNDWLYLWLGPNRDGSVTGFPFSRVE